MTSTTDLFDHYASLRRAIALEASNVFKEMNLGTRQFIILWSLNRRKKMTVGDLVEASMTDPSTVSRAIVPLIADGLIEKARCEKDGRVHYVRLTPKGQELAPEMDRLYRQLAQRCFGSLKPQEREELGQLLNKIVIGLQPVVEPTAEAGV